MNQTTDRFKTQILIIGSGIAGSTAALQLAQKGMEVTLLTSGNDLNDGNTALAQGGIVYQGKEEIPQHLEQDIFSAGWQCNYHRAVRYLSRKGPDIVKQLLLDKLQIPFEREENNAWKLVKEGGHSQARVLYCADYTGKAIMDGLMQAVKQEPNIKILTNRTAIDLLTSHHHSTTMEYRYHLTNRCVGAYVFNQYFNQVETILADFTLLTTGGIGQIYLHTTNTASSIGSGLTMAFRAGAKVMNMEYIQFHPTSLFHRAERRFLISEAVRGEGAKLINSKGERFMTKYDHRADLAPRDIVTRAIVDEMLHSGEPCVYLDVANYFDQDAASRFPTIYKKCKEIGIDMAKDPIPVVPAAHYFCGGILVNIQGRTTLERLYAAGECSCTGVHGANRLASTSLLEGILWGWSAARDINKRIKTQGDQKTTLSKKLQQAIPDWVNPGNKNNEDPALIAQDWATIRHTMWNYVGISRPTSRLKRAFEDLQSLNVRLHDFYRQTPISKPLVDLFHGCQSAYIVTQAALRNKTSLGCHYRPGK